MKLAIEVVREIEGFYCTCIELEIFDCQSSRDLEELMISEMDMIYDFDIDVESLQELAFKASMEFASSRDADWLQEAIIRTQQLDFLKDLIRMIYDLDIIFSEREIDEDEEEDRWV
jgi:predicted glycosyltransferase